MASLPSFHTYLVYTTLPKIYVDFVNDKNRIHLILIFLIFEWLVYKQGDNNFSLRNLSFGYYLYEVPHRATGVGTWRETKDFR